MNEKYDISVNYREPQPPIRFDNESDSDFEQRVRDYELVKDKAFWRVIMRTGHDSDITKMQHCAIESPMFPKNGDGWKYALILALTTSGTAISSRE